VALGVSSRIGVGRLALHLLLKVHLRVPLLFVAPGKLATTLITGEWLFTGVRAHMSGQVVAPRERAHADAALKRFLTGMDTDVPCELVAA